MRKIVLNFFLVVFALCMVQESYAQGRKVTGKVVSAGDGLPLPGASVLIKGTQEGVTAEFDGTYSINVKDGNVTLVFEFMGYQILEKKVQGQAVVNASLVEEAEQIGEITITTGYDNVVKRKFTGAVSKITEKDLKMEGVPDVSRMIEGKAAGVTVQNVTGSFGAAPKITVRGSSSIFGDTKPLWVIDGVVQEDIVNVSFEDLASGNAETLLSSAVAGLNSSDVSSIEILKDASATSIYGARAMNGVVVITTKSGRRESPLTISYNLENTMREVPSYKSFDIMNSQETLGVLRDLDDKGLLTLPSVAQGRYGGVYNLYANEVLAYNPTTQTYDLANTDIDKYDFLRKYEYANTDWFKTLFRPSIMQNHSLSFTGGGKNSSYFASIGYLSDPGWTLADDVRRITANLKTTFYVNDKLNIALSSMASVRKQHAPGSYDSKKDAVGGSVTRDFDINPFNYALNTSRALRPYNDAGGLEYYRQNWAKFNILNELENNFMVYDVKDLKFQVDLDYKIAKNITFNSSGSARYVSSDRVHEIHEGSNIIGAYRADETKVVKDQNIFLYEDPRNPGSTKQVVLNEGGILHKYSNTLLSYNFRNSLTYRGMFGETGAHELDVFVGQELRHVDRERDNYSGYGMQFDKGFVPFTDPRLIEKLITGGEYYFGKGLEKERTVGFFGKVGYTFDNRYTVSLTGRYDASNQQGQGGAVWLPTWTVSGKWNTMQEKFMMNQNFFSDLSFRGSYGLTATAGPASNALAIFRNKITDSRERPGDRESSLEISELMNADLTWEKQYEGNIGFDMGMANNRVIISADVYKRDAFDLIDLVRTSGIGGQELKWGNNADMVTKGAELSLTTRNIVTPNFTWTSNVNVSYYDQEITKLANEPRAFELISGTGGNVVGNPRNGLYSYQFIGLTDKGLPQFIQAAGETDAIGGANFQDNDNVANYLKYEGALEPNKSLGFSNTFTYKNWSLDVMVVASGGNVVRLNPVFASDYDDTQIFTREMNDRWTMPGDEAFTNVPGIADATTLSVDENRMRRAYNTYNYSDQRVAKGDFVRVKNLSLGYEFPDFFKKSIGVSAFTLKATVTNPFLLYSDKKLNGQDPEFYRTGGVSMPITRQFTFSLNLSI